MQCEIRILNFIKKKINMLKTISCLKYILLILFLSFSCSKGDGITQTPTLLQTTQTESESISENEEDTQPQNQTTQEYFTVTFKGNGTYQRENSPYSPIQYSIELLSGNIDSEGKFSKGSNIKLILIKNPGWDIDYSQIDRTIIDQGVQIENDLEILLNVMPDNNNFPYDELNLDGTFINVGSNIGGYQEWNEPNEELNFYVTNNFFYSEYIEAYKDRIFEIQQLLGKWGPLDILIFDWEGDPNNNREMFLKTRQERAAKAYELQLISNPETWVDDEMKRYDEIVSNNGWPFGSADAPMGMRKQIGSIYKNNYIEYVEMWSNTSGLTVDDLIQSKDFHWEWGSGSYHEYIHIWQASQNKHGFISEIGGCHNCNDWTTYDPKLNAIWVAPRWFQEGQCAVIQSILSEKMALRIEQGHCCSIPPEIFKVRNYIEKYLLNKNLDRLRRDETGLNGYYTVGEAASFYKFAKMNYSLETYMAFETKRGSDGYASAMQEYLGISEDSFYIEFNNWYFDSNLTDQQKLDYLYPEGINPILMDIQKRR